MAKPKYLHEVGFLGTGAVSRTFLAECTALRAVLGPVYTPAKRATPRVVTALNAGFAVHSMEEMAGCRYLLVCAGVCETNDLLAGALASGMLSGVELLSLVESSIEAAVPRDLSEAVREVGRIRTLPLRKRPAYVLEGSLRFRRFWQGLLDVPLSRLMIAKSQSRTMVDAGIFLAEELCLPLLEATHAAFMGAGVARDQARELAAELLRESIENACFAGRKRWTGILQTRDARRLGEIAHALRVENELLANLALAISRRGLAVMGKDAGWIPQLPGLGTVAAGGSGLSSKSNGSAMKGEDAREAGLTLAAGAP